MAQKYTWHIKIPEADVKEEDKVTVQELQFWGGEFDTLEEAQAALTACSSIMTLPSTRPYFICAGEDVTTDSIRTIYTISGGWVNL